jgi:hypothetical protein
MNNRTLAEVPKSSEKCSLSTGRDVLYLLHLRLTDRLHAQPVSKESLIAIVATEWADEQHAVQQQFSQAFSSRPVNRLASTARASDTSPLLG